MREYARVSPTFWTGATGRALRERGTEGALMALYLISSPLSNMLGLYYQPLLYAAEETGLGIEGASKGLLDCIEVGFCKYDEASKTVWVIEMAAWQIAEELKELDKRCAGIQKEYSALPDNPFLGEWFDRYGDPFHLTKRRGIEAPSKPSTGKAQAQAHEHAQEQAQESFAPASAGLGNLASDLLGDTPTEQVNGRKRSSPVPFKQIVQLYHAILCPPLPMVEDLSPKREGQIRARWQNKNHLPEIEHWKNFFEDVSQKPFLMGRKPGSNGRKPFRASLEWLTNETNFLKIAEGQYDE
jgi:hypothetical protein